MGFELEQEMNDHFAPFYPYVADEVLAEYGSASGRVLEVGPYGPGVSIALARKCPEMSFVCGDESGEALAYIRKCVRGEKLTRRVEILNIDKDSLLFDADTFDLVIFRGGLFFWEGQERILSEMNRVLKPGGLGAHGGGFGAGAPDELIELHLKKARALNSRLKKKRLSEEDVKGIVKNAKLDPGARIAKRHGLWIYWRKK
ncbi:MAG: class I SAM-dependent methyltransferase [Nitrospinota bacterium]|mgnify:FL=1|jgi:ubiquinone/menaquinone biosynthesis C-methylase UbiE|nr:class I SAM-dependent methyltransferase [Nitrospinota bacterium]MDP6366064.1 class I SAM-dependent methyltransferase [Nitrospinota bacterium]MDP7369104.1 class I SAM-dependent methyltransferase [Nitrospinota bacterium]MDP7502851.1 class I SAM-dependent methyltransferase [Nitrospinota bacterium]MDP7664761.1 class I SAM-dependent methyltransferase [Nitrospinota bacterium]|tara:strand:- start:479 stop:1081 length:603 start_codon:yes stop_codon:yes gene_type:complete